MKAINMLMLLFASFNLTAGITKNVNPFIFAENLKLAVIREDTEYLSKLFVSISFFDGKLAELVNKNIKPVMLRSNRTFIKAGKTKASFNGIIYYIVDKEKSGSSSPISGEDFIACAFVQKNNAIYLTDGFCFLETDIQVPMP